MKYGEQPNPSSAKPEQALNQGDSNGLRQGGSNALNQGGSNVLNQEGSNALSVSTGEERLPLSQGPV